MPWRTQSFRCIHSKFQELKNHELGKKELLLSYFFLTLTTLCVIGYSPAVFFLTLTTLCVIGYSPAVLYFGVHSLVFRSVFWFNTSYTWSYF